MPYPPRTTARSSFERQCESRARRQPHLARTEQAAFPSGLRGRDVGKRHERQERLGLRIDVAVAVARDHEAAAGCGVVDRREPIVLVAHVLVVLVSQPDIDGEVAANPPVVLGEQMEPVRAAVLIAASDAGDGGRRIAEQEIGERVAAELTGVGERAARVVRLLGPELQVKVVAAELDAMRASVEQDVVVHLEMLVVAIRERRRIAERAVQPARRDLRIARRPGDRS